MLLEELGEGREEVGGAEAKYDEDITPYLYAYITDISTGYLSQLLL